MENSDSQPKMRGTKKKACQSKLIFFTVQALSKIWVIRPPGLPKILGRTLSSYPIRTDKSFTLLLWWTTQLIQYVPIHDKNPVTSWQCFEMHIFNTDLLSAKLQHRTPLLTAQTVRFISVPLILSLSGRSTGTIRLFTPITLYSVFPLLTRTDKVPEVQYTQDGLITVTHCINCYSTALFTRTLV